MPNEGEQFAEPLVSDARMMGAETEGQAARLISLSKAEFDKILNTFSQKQSAEGEPTNRQIKEHQINRAFSQIAERLNQLEFQLSDSRRAVLKLKIARYFQKNTEIDIN